MKKISVFLLCALLLVAAGCGKEPKEAEPTAAPYEAPTEAPAQVPTEEPTPEPTATPEPTPEPTPTATPVPSGDPAFLKVDNIGLLAGTAKMGDVLDITGEEGDYYVVSLDGEMVLISKKMVQLSHEAPYAEWEGYARSGAKLNESPYMTGNDIESLGLNTAIAVKADLGDTLLVEVNGKVGYMHLRDVSTSKIATYSGGGSSSGGGDTGSDGDDIELSNHGTLGGILRLSNAAQYPTQGTVLAEGAELYYCIMNSSIPVTVIPADGENKGMKAVLYNGFVGAVPEELVRMDGDKPFEPWMGYAIANASAYGNHRKLGEIQTLGRNTELTVVDEIGSLYLVKVGEVTCFMEADQISKTKIKSSSGGSSSGGGDDWTEPVL